MAIEVGKMSPREAEGISKLAQLRKGHRATEPDELPADPDRGVEALPFVWVILGGTEAQEAMAAAVKRLDEIDVPREMLGAKPLEDELGWQVLARAMRDPEDLSQPIAADVDELRDLLNDDERDILMTRYADFQERKYPAPHDLSLAELKAMEEAAKKKSPESLAQLMSFGSWSLGLFVISLVSRLETLASGSSGSSTESAEGSSIG